MMRIDHASVFFQNWTSSKGLSEVQETFTSIDELFDLCAVTKMSPERVLLSGKDDAGREHFLTLLYGAMRVAPDDASEEQHTDDSNPSLEAASVESDRPQESSSHDLERAVLDAMSHVRTPAGPPEEDPSYLGDIRELCHGRAWDATVRLSDLAQALSSLADSITWAQKVLEFRGAREADGSEPQELAAVLEGGVGRLSHMRSMLAVFDRQLIALSGLLAK